MKASLLVAKLNKLIEINPDANVYFYAEEDGMKFLENRYLNGRHLSDIGLVLSRSYENGEGLISIDTENTNVGIENENKKNKKSRCEHETVLEIYKDDTQEEISHYRCVQCGDKENFPFGKNIVKKK
jgi:hypothetical protein